MSGSGSGSRSDSRSDSGSGSGSGSSSGSGSGCDFDLDLVLVLVLVVTLFWFWFLPQEEDLAQSEAQMEPEPQSQIQVMEDELAAKSMAIEELSRELEEIRRAFGAEGGQQVRVLVPSRTPGFRPGSHTTGFSGLKRKAHRISSIIKNTSEKAIDVQADG